MKRYVVRWIEHHSLEVDADSSEEAEGVAMGGDGMTDSSRTYCYAEIESIDEQAEQKEVRDAKDLLCNC